MTDNAMTKYGRCDTCGATCDAKGCKVDRNHAASIDPFEEPAKSVPWRTMTEDEARDALRQAMQVWNMLCFMGRSHTWQT